ncbi:gamma-glutamyl-gamma-aminobutyrate hydrolase family protein [Paenactinomyces guangxiensis]|uniref:Gamma-glutamyl-gamma-aminobutyrate hydrolase family protein n=2 Tax=Paenactinomyces guangxiensis TaxID=1490290 RepID=A0A7W2A7M3_9BACL|nr:gamma-glutamyl-gamma-aminobutyrate hydrolase family protein [Paenactinomyces guangxiensis]MBH8589870.1 gamma-glutamyl-gamma-aminobutyrate hydrolase family protein [Paenactinomyces guangxiensis]
MSVEQEKKLFLMRDYSDAIIQAGGIPLLLPYTEDTRVIEGMAAKCDGLMLTGGGDIDPTLFGEEPIPGLGEIVPERDQMEIELVRYFIARKKPILGICRGCQILNIALEGDMFQDLTSQKSPLLQHAQRAPRSHASHTIQIKEGSLLSQIVNHTAAKVNSYHHQAVREPAPSLVASAWSSDGVIEAIEGKSHPFVLGVQWHPECMTSTQTEAAKIFQAFVDACSGQQS